MKSLIVGPEKRHAYSKILKSKGVYSKEISFVSQNMGRIIGVQDKTGEIVTEIDVSQLGLRYVPDYTIFSSCRDWNGFGPKDLICDIEISPNHENMAVSTYSGKIAVFPINIIDARNSRR